MSDINLDPRRLEGESYEDYVARRRDASAYVSRKRDGSWIFLGKFLKNNPTRCADDDTRKATHRYEFTTGVAGVNEKQGDGETYYRVIKTHKNDQQRKVEYH